MKKSALISHSTFFKHNLKGHPENAGRLSAFLRKLPEYRDITQFEAEPVSYETLKKVHDEDYINRIKEASRKGVGFLDPDTYVNSFTYEAALLAAGSLEQAVKLTQEGYRYIICAVRPPGHHAERNRAMGFCIFNNIAVGAVSALDSGYNRVFIVDFDAHHGNGTQNAFYHNPQVFYLSTHQYPFYPGTGSSKENNEHILNFPLKAGASDPEFAKVYGEYFPQAAEMFEPDILLVSAGFDMHEEDPMSELKVSDAGMEFILEQMRSVADALGIPLVIALEGGYNYSVLERAGEKIYRLFSL
ncbi:MAG: histone deacetylase [Deferribacteres bacterium]|nr:histone deacetylase [Deferribacteres bacterium]